MSSLSPEVPEGAAVYQERVIKTRRGGEQAANMKLAQPHVLGLQTRSFNIYPMATNSRPRHALFWRTV